VYTALAIQVSFVT